MEDVLTEFASMVYLSGHERNREVMRFYDNVFVGSGAPEEARHVGRNRQVIFSSDNPGITIIDYDVNGNVFTRQFAYLDGAFHEEDNALIMQAPCLHPDPEIVVNERLVPCLQEAYVLTEMMFEHPDTVSVTANPAYDRSGFVRFWFGDHYRESWSSPVEVPVLNLDTAFGGIVPYSIGGGRQTKSLKFYNDNGYAYVFRSVDKDPSRALSLDLRNSLISLAVQDQTTTQYPYGAVVASSLLDSLDILHAKPQVYVMPDDPKLGPYQDRFGGMLGMLEDFPTGNKEITQTFADADDIKRSVSMFRRLYKDGHNRIDTKEYLRARVFDLFVGDWGKHEDNWKWAGFDQDEGTLFRPIPRDRDHVFSRWDGVLPWISDREWAKPSGENFGMDVKDMRSLTWQTRHIDRFLANELTREDWQEAAQFVSNRLDSTSVENAIKSLPNGYATKDADEIEQKLKSRLGKLDEFADRYYDLLAKQVDVVGSVDEERFVVTRLPDGKVRVQMYELISRDEVGALFYDRLFDPEETKEIRLFGLLGNDQFVIDGDAKRSILIRIVPGQGVDMVADSSHVRKGGKRTRVYSRDRQEVVVGNEIRNVNIPYDDAYIYRRTAFHYNTYLPYLVAFFTTGNGFQVGGGVSFTRHAYDKPDYSAQHNLSASASTLGNYHFEYVSSIRHVLGKWDLTIAAQASKHKQFNYFFGLGNESEYNKDSINNGYNTLQYSNVFAEVGLKREFWKRSSFHTALHFASYSGESGSGNILDDLQDDIPGKEPFRIARLKWDLDIDFLNRRYLPERGMRLVVNGQFSQVNE